MTRRTRLVGWIIILVAVVAGIVWWQYAKLGRGLRTMPAGTAGEVLISSLSKQVLAPGVDGPAQDAGPLLDQYRKNPELIRQRYRLVMTWVHASKIFKAIGQNPSFNNEMVSRAGGPGPDDIFQPNEGAPGPWPLGTGDGSRSPQIPPLEPGKRKAGNLHRITPSRRILKPESLEVQLP